MHSKTSREKVERVARALVERERKEELRRAVLKAAIDLADEDEAFRRALLNALRKRGRGKRGRPKSPAHEIEKEYLEGIFERAQFMLTLAGKPASITAAAKYIVDDMGLFRGTDPETLRRRYERAMKKNR